MTAIRQATMNDVRAIHRLVFNLACIGSTQPNESFHATEFDLASAIFEIGALGALVAIKDGNTVGCATYHKNFSTFLGRSGTYMQDLYVIPEARKRGVGKQLVCSLAQLTLETEGGRLEWLCSKTNKSGISFYRCIGATIVDEWTQYRLDGIPLVELSEKNASNFTFRSAYPEDVALVKSLIIELAVYEGLEHRVEASIEVLEKSLFAENAAEVVFVESDGELLGSAVFYPTYSTYTGRSGLYIEDLFVLPQSRGRGAGKALLGHLAQRVLASNGARLEWGCFNFNTPSVNFYQALGARPLTDWVFRLEGESLARAAQAASGAIPMPH